MLGRIKMDTDKESSCDMFFVNTNKAGPLSYLLTQSSNNTRKATISTLTSNLMTFRVIVVIRNIVLLF